MEETFNQEEPRRRGRPRVTERQIPDHPEDFINYYRNLSFIEREKTIRAGITKRQLVCLKEVLKFDYDTLAGTLGITTRALFLRKLDQPFSRLLSDRIAILLELYCYGLDVFGEHELLLEWLTTPNETLLNQRPIDLLHTHPGVLEVRARLHRLCIGQF
ncbi:antitoxin Xre/MbcA/ParS toxin-binding domain-containing protein [Chitinophaga rhizosphaerae]|uniref:antitoxin Xre/MbcA/ParS toxin-binding domain-containing protein n=1 Tax=Chitinophaga rhizosphaerae TaxID=1864947 RepID=UPI000F813193|nr:antitoxin Xre/MbcA/ParS toxin-binding domain-containing protein [Chitinophaga rhizosphaerae]